ncbi:MAG: FHA domain-containing protein [Acidobacteriia bacterium]|nr:FHA domain-containing protein [Terriglobia bacterium]
MANEASAAALQDSFASELEHAEGMSRSGTPQARPIDVRVSGQTIIDELIRNMELGRLEMAYAVLLPCVFSVYVHPDDYNRLRAVENLIRDDARKALETRMAEWNRKSPFRHAGGRKNFKIAREDWWIALFSDTEGSVPPGDVEIHSELNDMPQPGYRGVKTTLIDREPSVTAARVARDRESTRFRPVEAHGSAREEHARSEKVFAEIHYRDDSGPQTYFITQNAISIGRGGEEVWVDLPLYTADEVSREHLLLRRNPATGAFSIIDKSRNGTWLNGRRLARDSEVALPDRAEIGIAEVLKLSFHVRR